MKKNFISLVIIVVMALLVFSSCDEATPTISELIENTSTANKITISVNCDELANTTTITFDTIDEVEWAQVVHISQRFASLDIQDMPESQILESKDTYFYKGEEVGVIVDGKIEWGQTTPLSQFVPNITLDADKASEEVENAIAEVFGVENKDSVNVIIDADTEGDLLQKILVEYEENGVKNTITIEYDYADQTIVVPVA